MIKRIFDVSMAIIGGLILLPFMLIISLCIVLSSRGGVFFIQDRIGRKGKTFSLFKFRTMKPGSEASGQLTVGGRDPRITGIGNFLRKTKLDELPQFLNIIAGDMSFVGPRPEVPRYVAIYTDEQLKVLDVRPGLTDYASLEYFEENKLLGESDDPEKTYIEEVMPAKLALSLRYIEEQGFGTDLKIIFRTIGKIFS